MRIRQILRDLVSIAVRYDGPDICIEFTSNAEADLPGAKLRKFTAVV